MQENGAAAGTSEPTWYLARGDQQWGPLADRELVLLAERGGLKTDDLLWRPGFETWQPLRAVCDFLPSTQATTAELAVSSETPRSTPSLRARLYHELKSFLMIFAYLWLVFFVFLVHEWSVLASHQIGFRFYGLAVVNALVLSKIMLIAEDLHFADRFADKPLIHPIAFKSVAFTVLLMVAYIVEEIAVGLFHGKTVAESFPEIGGGGAVGVLTIGAIMGIALVPFFSFREIARAMGEAEFRAMVLGPPREKRTSAGPEPQSIHP